MLYYSEKLDKTFKTEEECLAAEKEVAVAKEAQKEQEEARLKEIVEAHIEWEEAAMAENEAWKKYLEVKDKFENDYNCFISLEKIAH